MFRGSTETIVLLGRCVTSVACAAPLVACAAPDVSGPSSARIGSTSTELVSDFAVLPAFGTDAPFPTTPFGKYPTVQLDPHVI